MTGHRLPMPRAGVGPLAGWNLVGLATTSRHVAVEPSRNAPT